MTRRSKLRALGSRTSVLVGAFAVLVAAVYLFSPIIQSGDGRLVVYEADSIIHEQHTDLHQYGVIVDGFPCYRHGPRILSRYPYGTALVTAPFLFVAETAGKLVGSDPAAHIRQRTPLGLEKDLASVIAALGCLALVLLVIEATGRLAPALLIGVLFAFGTAMWSTVSRGLWQHGPLILLETIALILLVRGRDRDDWRWEAAAGLPLGAAWIVRPTALIPLALVGVYLLTRSRRTAVVYTALAVVLIAPSIAYNERIYGTALNPFYFHNGSGFLDAGLRNTFFTGLGGTMISPARGLLVYSPFVLAALVGMVWPRRRRSGLNYVALATVAFTWLVTANTLDWAGGFSYGPRLLSDTFPWLALLLAPVADALTRAPASWTRTTRLVVGFLVLAFGWSVFVNARGALSWSTQVWNDKPVAADVGTHPGRFWDWSDPQFLRASGNTMKDIYPTDLPPAIPLGSQCAAT